MHFVNRNYPSPYTPRVKRHLSAAAATPSPSAVDEIREAVRQAQVRHVPSPQDMNTINDPDVLGCIQRARSVGLSTLTFTDSRRRMILRL